MSNRTLPGSHAKNPQIPKGLGATTKSPYSGTSLSPSRKPRTQQQKAATDKKNHGNGEGKSNGRRYGAYGGYKGVSYRRAGNLADAMLGDQIRALTPQIGQANRFYDRSVGDINHVFNESGDYINYENGLINQQTQSAQSASAALAQQLSSQLGATQGGAVGSVDGELSRLGIGDSGMPGYFAAEGANAQNIGSLTGANAQSNIALMGQGASQVGNLLLGSNAGSRSSSLGKSANTRDETVAQVQEAIRGVQAGRKDLMLQLLEQLSQTGWAQYMDQTQLNMSKKAMAGGRASGSSSAGYGGGSSSGSSSSSSGGNTYYGDKVDGLIDALTGGGKKPKGKPKKSHRPTSMTEPTSFLPNPNYTG